MFTYLAPSNIFTGRILFVLSFLRDTVGALELNNFLDWKFVCETYRLNCLFLGQWWGMLPVCIY